MNIHKAMYTAREWDHGLGMKSFYLSGKVINENHRTSLINEIKHEQKWLSDCRDESYGEKDAEDLANLLNVAEWASAGTLLVKVPNPPESIIRLWDNPQPQEHEDE